MLKNKLVLSAIVLGSLLFSGCSTMATKYTDVKQPNESVPIVNIKVDVDSTSLGFINVGNVERENYLYAFGAAAQTTLNHNYKYFTIISPNGIVTQYKNRKVKNLQDAYDACNSGDGSFAVFVTNIASDISGNSCDSIAIAMTEPTLTGGSVRHAIIFFTIKMSNEKLSNYASFDAKEVLNSELLEGLDRDYFKRHKR